LNRTHAHTHLVDNHHTSKKTNKEDQMDFSTNERHNKRQKLNEDTISSLDGFWSETILEHLYERMFFIAYNCGVPLGFCLQKNISNYCTTSLYFQWDTKIFASKYPNVCQEITNEWLSRLSESSIRLESLPCCDAACGGFSINVLLVALYFVWPSNLSPLDVNIIYFQRDNDKFIYFLQFGITKEKSQNLNKSSIANGDIKVLDQDSLSIIYCMLDTRSKLSLMKTCRLMRSCVDHKPICLSQINACSWFNRWVFNACVFHDFIALMRIAKSPLRNHINYLYVTDLINPTFMVILKNFNNISNLFFGLLKKTEKESMLVIEPLIKINQNKIKNVYVSRQHGEGLFIIESIMKNIPNGLESLSFCLEDDCNSKDKNHIFSMLLDYKIETIHIHNIENRVRESNPFEDVMPFLNQNKHIKNIELTIFKPNDPEHRQRETSFIIPNKIDQSSSSSYQNTLQGVFKFILESLKYPNVMSRLTEIGIECKKTNNNVEILEKLHLFTNLTKLTIFIERIDFHSSSRKSQYRIFDRLIRVNKNMKKLNEVYIHYESFEMIDMDPFLTRFVMELQAETLRFTSVSFPCVSDNLHESFELRYKNLIVLDYDSECLSNIMHGLQMFDKHQSIQNIAIRRPTNHLKLKLPSQIKRIHIYLTYDKDLVLKHPKILDLIAFNREKEITFGDDFNSPIFIHIP
jgi:hypothetical protein